MEHTITIEPTGQRFSVPHGTRLSDVLRHTALEFPCGDNGRCGNCRVELISGDIALTDAHAALLKEKGMGPSWRLACMSWVERDLTIRIPESAMNTTIDESPLSHAPEEGLGIAADLGSTTIVLQLVDLRSGRVIRTKSGVNPQTSYGADIISRISYAIQGEEHLRELSGLTRNFIGGLIREMCNEDERRAMSRMVIAGNTVMHHIFASLDLAPLASAPFQSPHNEAVSFAPGELGWDLPDTCPILFLPNLSHFIGSDILCGIKKCGMHESNRWQLLIDLGTNGEMALGCRERILCASTAAGPAFEGINIACGMRAVDGAIYAIDRYADGRPHLHTIADATPRGFCGSGLIEAVHYLFSHEIIDCTGAFVDTDRTCFHFDDSVFLDIKDIREFQLAKAALCAGVDLLVEEAGIAADEIGQVFVTGGLGYYINIDKMQQLGMFGQFDKHRFDKLPNASLGGAKHFLFKNEQAEVPRILALVKHCPLESVPAFQNIFCEKMFFPF